MPKLTLEQRRRETLRRQLYGKEESAISLKRKPESEKTADSSKTFSLPSYSTSTSRSETLDASYLTRDLGKILIFSVLAIGTQLSLYFLLQNHLAKLPF